MPFESTFSKLNNGASISDNGLTPDYEVKIKIENLKANKDPQTEKAIEILNQN
ncbi:MAG: hypothetical protein AAB530_02910 [Patescibacteria group bacterium]